MAESGLILALDNGTQSLRALLFDLRGELVAKAKVELEAYYSHSPGWAEQDPDYFWKQLGEACRQLWQCSGVNPSRVVAVSLTTQRGTVINLDKQGDPLRPAILWLDQRRARVSAPLPQPWRTLFWLAGQREKANYFRSKAQANWIAQQQPEIYAHTHKVLLLSGYLTYRLCGEYRDSVGAIVGYLPFDYRKQQWAAPSHWGWPCSGVKPGQLPELVKPGELLGKITLEASATTGIPAGLPLIAAASDKACEVLGSGGLSSDVGCLSFGTTATININSQRYIEPQRFIPPYAAAVPDAYNTEVMIYRGFWMVSWFKQQFGLRESQRAQDLGLSPEALFDELVREVPAGSMGLMLQPYWSPGLNDRDMKGAVIGFGDLHTRSHLYRAILEGLVYGLREGKEQIEARSGQKIQRLCVSGGGSQSDAALQITADIFGLPVTRPHTYETSGLGAAIDAAVGVGLFQDFPDAVAAMTRSSRVFTPNPEAHRLYDQLYRRVYRKMYRRLKPLYREIRSITGYPE
ncbi:FGGY-family carbohydrate kinase [Aestuariirhabdus litorea]|uniref:Carbohydrate kinase n=1 Tax=Aestuariirhabdus litorea TaxID=2528527 RepID=A0A3P3VV69_9GAMM|nr:FGGY-family carbohydrate kinase [Aestuariirhabdus litorea]RRJ84643.1 carbohydrate kinase [Aestuariirhabdus litorea]RWW97868.1 carbohydrate kinase [Endozoicomonadaceae bacterium GTF-13]